MRSYCRHTHLSAPVKKTVKWKFVFPRYLMLLERCSNKMGTHLSFPTISFYILFVWNGNPSFFGHMDWKEKSEKETN